MPPVDTVAVPAAIVPASSKNTRTRIRSPSRKAVDVGVTVKLFTAEVVPTSVVLADLATSETMFNDGSSRSITTLTAALTAAALSFAQMFSVMVPAIVTSADSG